MSYYPQVGDVEGWFAWHRDHQPSADEAKRFLDVLCIFESGLWCQRSKVRALRATAVRNAGFMPELVAEMSVLQRILAFLNQDTMNHRNHAFKQYRERLRQGRFLYAKFNNIEVEYPYDEIDMEIVRCEMTI